MQTYTQDQISLLKTKETEIYKARMQRQSEALKVYIETAYPNPPKPKLESLQFLLTTLEKKLESDPDNTSLVDYIQLQKDKIANGDYAQSGSADMEYHNTYHAHVKSFQWPDQNELEIRAVEDLVIKNLQDSFHENTN